MRDVRLVDHHAHNLLRWEETRDVPYSAAFTEGRHPWVESAQSPHSLFYRRSLKDMAALLECDSSEDEVLSRRRDLGLEELSRRCFEAAGLECLYLDDGLLPDRILPLSWHEQFVPCRRVLRLERLGEELLARCPDFEDFREQFRTGLRMPAVALKSIAAYRTGLSIDPDPEFARRRYRSLCGVERLTDKPMVDFLVNEALEVAASIGRPIQFHTGFGDPDLDLRWANPLHLRPLIERYEGAPVVLLHASYPFCREAGFLASVYPNVYVDFGLAVPFLSRHGMRAAVAQLTELAPLRKILYSSDASRIPDLYYLGALWGRRTVCEILEQCVRDGELSAAEAEDYGCGILRENALALYGGIAA
ncbi:MAG: amidohydrolase family protein [Armatimonadetes bacterium]|nr:amidohydrolase family protein [Armatimonadota bacterium]